MKVLGNIFLAAALAAVLPGCTEEPAMPASLEPPTAAKPPVKAPLVAAQPEVEKEREPEREREKKPVALDNERVSDDQPVVAPADPDKKGEAKPKKAKKKRKMHPTVDDSAID